MSRTIRFGNKKASKIENETFINKIHEKLAKIGYDLSNKGYNFLDKKNINKLKTSKYLVSITTFGKKFLLFLTKINNINYCFFIYKKKINEIFIVNFNFDDDLYNDTVFDGEFVKNIKDNWCFLISDILFLKNNNISEHPLLNKLDLIENIFNNNFEVNNDKDVCSFELKEYFEYDYISSICSYYINTTPFKCSGIIFKKFICNDNDLIFIFPENRSNQNTSNCNIEVKTKSLSSSICSTSSLSSMNFNNDDNSSDSDDVNTKNQINPNINNNDDIILKLKTTDFPDVYEIFCVNNSNEEIKFGISAVPNMKLSLKLNKDFEKYNFNYYKCIFNDKYGKYEPIELCDRNNFKISNINTLIKNI